MKSGQRRKLFAGVGLISMLSGALMVLVPAGAGASHTSSSPAPAIYDTNVLCTAAGQGEGVQGLGYDHEITFGGIEGSLDSVSAGPTEGVSYTSTVTNGVRHFEWTSTLHTIYAVVVKQGDDAAVFSYEPSGATSGTVYVATGNTTGVSHLGFCWNDPEAPSLTVTKQIASTDPALLDDSFPVSVSQGETVVESGSLADDQSLDPIDPATGAYTISETLPATGWQAPTISCTGATASGAAGGPWTVTVDAVDVACTITNTPVPVSLTHSATIEKLNNANGDQTYSDMEEAAAAGDDVEFQVTITNTGTGPLTVTSLEDEFDGETVDLLEDVELDCVRSGGSVELEAGSVLPAGSVTTCTFTLEDYAPAGDDPLVNVVTLDTEEAPDVDDDSTVTTAEVLGDVVIRDVERTPETPQPEVRGDVVTRTLPRTGNENRNLAAFGAGLLLLGAGLVLTSRSRFARAD